MSEELLKNVQEMLNEEKWTRATLSNYTANQFKDLDAILKQARDSRCENELQKLCYEHLSHSKNSIIALYLGGITSLSQQIIDDAAMVSLISIFVDNHKWVIVKHLCDRMLDYGESKFALRTLADCYKNENNEEAKYGVWERLVKVDYDEADLAKALAERYENLSHLESAVDYYKKALHRYIVKQYFASVKEIWDKLLILCPVDIDFFLNVQKRVAKNFDELKAASLLKDVYVSCIKRDDINTAIVVLKLILEYDNDDRQARKDIADCYRKKYAEHSQLEAYIRVSSLAQGPRNVKEAVADFEKHISFDKGNFVFHRTWGVGRIAHVQGDDIVIDFAKHRGHSMSLKMAVNALQTLTKDHIWVLKATWKKEKLHDKVKTDPSWALKMVIRSFGNSCDLKRIKTELVPAVLTASEWTTWSSKAREILKTDPSFGLSPNDADIFTVRERPISIDEKLYFEFKAAKHFFDRAQVLRNYAAQKDAEIESEYFNEMFGYISGYLKAHHQVNEQVITSYLLVKDLVAQYPHLAGSTKLNFIELFEGIEDVPELFLNLKDTKLKEEFLKHIQLFVPGWTDIHIKLFLRFPTASIVASLLKEGYEDKLTSLVATCFENYRNYREAALWFYRNSSNEPWFKKAEIPYEKQLLTLIHVLDISYREMENRRDIPENRKQNKLAYTILFTEGLINDYVDAAETETITRVYTFINDISGLDPQDKLNLKNRILKRFPDFKFFGVEEKKTTNLGLIVTLAKYQEKQRQLANIIDVDIPANSKEIESAMLHGDLSENAEYKAAKERQAELNNMMTRLKGDLDRAQLFDPSHVNTAKVFFGTRVTLVDKNSGTKEEYTILGPWESDPNNRVISYMAPIGGAVLNKAVGDEVKLPNVETETYTVEAIASAF
ncbi:MAG: transcription elongation factor GreA [Treponema sp.]|jgi:transcription elongation factor GreA|nr:transcription elongation factor GreA [Treponema sp.]